jgi:hypothetical protein
VAESAIADLFRTHFETYIGKHGPLPPEHYKVAHAIMACRTESMGGHLWGCPQCDYELTMYNSCRNRHCPRCQAYASAQWVQARIDELLPVPYFHVVFTIPQQLNPFALRNKEVFYTILFSAVAGTLRQLATDPDRFGGTIGFIAILHTWGQNLMDHPHIHCVIPGGALDADHLRWIPSRKGFLFPVPVMRALFRGKFMAAFKKALSMEELQLHGSLEPYKDGVRMKELFDTLYKKDWVVYAKKPFANPQAVVKYLGSYTHRIAISDKRILSVDPTADTVTFSYKDYAGGGRKTQMTLQATEFIRRFLMHVVPSGFMRIRHYGFLSNSLKAALLPKCRVLLGEEPRPKEVKEHPVHWYEIIEALTGKDPLLCPYCASCRIVLRQEIPRRNTLSYMKGVP